MLTKNWDGTKPTIFLDIDGILNTTRSVVAFGMVSPFKYTPERSKGILSEKGGFDLVAVQLLKKLVWEFEANVVLSSSWRRYVCLTRFGFEAFGDHDFFAGATDIWDYKKDAPQVVLDLAEKFDIPWTSRGLNIEHFILENDVQNCVIFDDQDDMLEIQKPSFIHVNPEFGITMKDHHNAREILAKEKLDYPIVMF